MTRHRSFPPTEVRALGLALAVVSGTLAFAGTRIAAPDPCVLTASVAVPDGTAPLIFNLGDAGVWIANGNAVAAADIVPVLRARFLGRPTRDRVVFVSRAAPANCHDVRRLLRAIRVAGGRAYSAEESGLADEPSRSRSPG